MTTAEKLAKANGKGKTAFKANVTISGNLKSIADLIYGDKLWNVEQEIGSGVCENTPDTALEFGADISKLAAPAFYYTMSNFADAPPQIMVKLEEGSNRVLYAGLFRDKDGEAIFSDDHSYTINEVKSRREFTIPGAVDDNGNAVVIPAGFHTLKAVAE